MFDDVTDLSATLGLYCVIFLSVFILKWLTSIVLSENTQRQSNKARQWVIPFFPLIFAVTKLNACRKNACGGKWHIKSSCQIGWYIVQLSEATLRAG